MPSPNTSPEKINRPHTNITPRRARGAAAFDSPEGNSGLDLFNASMSPSPIPRRASGDTTVAARTSPLPAADQATLAFLKARKKDAAPKSEPLKSGAVKESSLSKDDQGTLAFLRQRATSTRHQDSRNTRAKTTRHMDTAASARRRGAQSMRHGVPTGRAVECSLAQALNRVRAEKPANPKAAVTLVVPILKEMRLTLRGKVRHDSSDTLLNNAITACLTLLSASSGQEATSSRHLGTASHNSARSTRNARSVRNMDRARKHNF